jgi:hypothetical protein
MVPIEIAEDLPHPIHEDLMVVPCTNQGVEKLCSLKRLEVCRSDFPGIVLNGLDVVVVDVLSVIILICQIQDFGVRADIGLVVLIPENPGI